MAYRFLLIKRLLQNVLVINMARKSETGVLSHAHYYKRRQTLSNYLLSSPTRLIKKAINNHLSLR